MASKAGNWLIHLPYTSQPIDDLVSQGYAGFDLADIQPWFCDSEFYDRISRLPLIRTGADINKASLMTKDLDGLDSLLDWMLETFGQCPKVYSPEEELEVPDAIPLLRPIATNLPDGMTSEEAFADGVIELIEETFAYVKESFGNQAHLTQIDYGSFADALSEHETLYLKGEFIDLTDGEIFEFTADGYSKKLSYCSTGRKDEGFRPQEKEDADPNESCRTIG